MILFSDFHSADSKQSTPQTVNPIRSLIFKITFTDTSNDKKFVCKESFWWDGFEIIPPRPKLGLLSAFVNRTEEPGNSEESTDECTEEESSSSSSTDSEGSAESNPVPKNKNLSARSNQDNQRAYEENAVREMTTILNKNTINETVRNCRALTRTNTPLGGVWVRLEAEWKDSFNQNVSQQKLKNIIIPKFSRSRGK
ncbi:hypothetical protein NQ314_013814 [Rhamnusium bicolor]|uniref:Uncharacterized protein n=1 Tax=Rhamnusium bicolor TaxID=1586634 RepID=A0AAV8X5T9_9CUCU|nr:hypothetical protein NQ314_013814 [Rhamnusium bicolor]